MQRIRDSVDEVQSRQQSQWLWHCVSWGLVLGGFAGCSIALARWMMLISVPFNWVVGAVIAGPLLGMVLAALWPCRTRNAAITIDRACGLKDRIATALRFAELPDELPLHKLQVADAEAHVSRIDAADVIPIRAPRSWLWGLSLTVAALLGCFLSGPPSEVIGAVVPNEIAVAQADRMSDSLRELEEFNQEEADPEIERLLKQLAEKIEELKQPGVDPREALAKLSEMELALQQKQQELAEQNTSAALQEIGEALSLAEPFESAGEAMAAGDLQKAADELTKLEMPELDRKTERAMIEKLNQAQNSGQGSNRNLKQAAGQVSQGLTNRDRSQFREGAQGLAGECRKQGRRKKLTDLLRQQCQCLSECKGNCEGQKTGNAKGKGGDSWGLGASGNEPGDPTSMLSTSAELKLTGEESADGDVDVETLSAPEHEQEAVRQYRAAAERYEQLSESVLSSEAIPLGHRQTIRRYFEMIRPEGAETDAVIEQTEQR